MGCAIGKSQLESVFVAKSRMAAAARWVYVMWIGAARFHMGRGDDCIRGSAAITAQSEQRSRAAIL